MRSVLCFVGCEPGRVGQKSTWQHPTWMAYQALYAPKWADTTKKLLHGIITIPLTGKGFLEPRVACDKRERTDPSAGYY